MVSPLKLLSKTLSALMAVSGVGYSSGQMWEMKEQSRGPGDNVCWNCVQQQFLSDRIDQLYDSIIVQTWEHTGGRESAI